MRVFIASFLTAESARRLAVAAPVINGVRPVPEENLHMTLHFIGEVPEAASAEICALVADLEGAPLNAAVEGLEGFPDALRARAVAARLKVPECVFAWQQTLEDGWPATRQPSRFRKRSFVPHVTIGRSSQGVSLRGKEPLLAGFMLELGAPAAYRSDTLANGARYSRLD